MLGTYRRLDVHIFASWRDVVRAAARTLSRETARDPATRDLRKVFYREMLQQHRDARQTIHRFRL